ncbi:MAG TPA: glycosyltransferase family 39 protein [Candidatus Dormibacteraeota bacterium]
MLHRRRTWIEGGVLLATLALLRAPSLIEPPWSADEGTYANIGRSLDLGGVLYRTVWDNKPPGVYWLAAAVSSGGASVLRVRVALCVLVAAGAALVWVAGRRLGSPRAGLVAALLFAVLASVPNFDGNQLNAEIPGAVFALAGMALLVARFPTGRVRAAGAGALLGAALLFKATFAADVLAGLAVPALAALAAGRRPGRAEIAPTALIGAGALAAVGLALVPLALQGARPAFVDVIVHPDTRYAQWAQLAGPNGGEPTGFDLTPSLLLQVLGITRLLAVLAAGAVLAVVLARRRRRSAALVTWWLSCDLAACMADSRGFTHYAQQLEGVLSIAAALAAAAAWRRRRPAWRVVAAGALVAVWPVMIGALFLPRAEAALAQRHRLPPVFLERSSGRQDLGYYARAGRLVLGRIGLDAYRADFAGSQYPADMRRAEVLRRHSRPGHPVFVWGWTSSWVYALADRRPASRFIWMNSAYHLYRGAERLLLADLASSPPEVLLAEQPLTPELRSLLEGRGYMLVADPAGDCWLAPGAPGRPDSS